MNYSTILKKAFSVSPRTLLTSGPIWGYKKYIRPRLPPSGTVDYNSVEVPKKRPLDEYIPGVDVSDNPYYESRLIKFIRKYVEEAESVIIVGGGWGVSTVVAARQVGIEGEVNTYEAGSRQTRHVQRTVKKNDVEQWVNIHHAVIGSAVGSFTSIGDADYKSGADLPSADVMVVDCDGAEFDVLKSIEDTNKPATIIVEHHGVTDEFGEIIVEYEPSNVHDLINQAGYKVKEYSEIDHIVEKNVHWVAELS